MGYCGRRVKRRWDTAEGGIKKRWDTAEGRLKEGGIPLKVGLKKGVYRGDVLKKGSIPGRRAAKGCYPAGALHKNRSFPQDSNISG